MSRPLIELEGLSQFFGKKPQIRAVEDINLSIIKGETLGLVGESGCGKTTLGRTILRLYEPTRGKIRYDGALIFDDTQKKQPDMRPYRRKMQMIFQNPGAALDPRMTIGESIGQALDIHHRTQCAAERTERIARLLGLLELSGKANQYPHACSGGQQQRVGIARALAVEPEFLVCDEPVSSLDVSVSAQIINMLEEMQVELGLTCLFIGHDISIVRHISDRIGVMYLGNLIELADSRELTQHPLHPYTKTLLSAIPDPTRRRQRILLSGELPSPAQPPSGCRFRTRCPYAEKRCEETVLMQARSKGHWVACCMV